MTVDNSGDNTELCSSKITSDMSWNEYPDSLFRRHIVWENLQEINGSTFLDTPQISRSGDTINTQEHYMEKIRFTWKRSVLSVRLSCDTGNLKCSSKIKQSTSFELELEVEECRKADWRRRRSTAGARQTRMCASLPPWPADPTEPEPEDDDVEPPLDSLFSVRSRTDNRWHVSC